MTNRMKKFLEIDSLGRGLALPPVLPSKSGYGERSVHVDSFGHWADRSGDVFPVGTVSLEAALHEYEWSSEDPDRHTVTLELRANTIKFDDDHIELRDAAALDAIISALLQLRQMPATQRILDQLHRENVMRLRDRREKIQHQKEEDDDRGDEWKA
jgi:tRNA threonylcarbamoyladenosine modification (KEOPS) complex  Pcc1 subunit